MREQRIVRFLAPKPVQCAVGQDAVKQHGQFIGGFVAVMRGQLHHAVLHDVQGRFLIADVVERALKGSLFNADEEIGEFFFGSQEFLGWRKCNERRWIIAFTWGFS